MLRAPFAMAARPKREQGFLPGKAGEAKNRMELDRVRSHAGLTVVVVEEGGSVQRPASSAAARRSSISLRRAARNVSGL